MVLVRGDWRGLAKGISVYPNHIGFWFWLEGIGEKNLSLAQPHKILVLVRGDWRKESQSILTIHTVLVLVKKDWRKESQFSPTTYRTLGLVDVSGQPNFEKTSFRRSILFIFTILTTQNPCSVSTVKRGQLS